jgi:hypothetical protein
LAVEDGQIAAIQQAQTKGVHVLEGGDSLG